MLIGSRIKELRKMRGYKQAELARRLCVVQSAVAHLESDRSNGINVQTLENVARALDVPMCVFFCKKTDCEVLNAGG